MFVRINQIIKNIEDLENEITISLNMAKLELIDYIMIKRGSQDMPPHLSMSLFNELDTHINELKRQIDALNKIKRELLVF